MQEARGEHGARVPCGDDRVGVAVGDGTNGPDERRIGLATDSFGRLVVHLDHPTRDDMVEALRAKARGTVDDRPDLGGRGGEGTGDDLIRGTVAPESVHGDLDTHPVYGAGVPSGWMSRPRYVLHVGQTWCARVGAPQFGHTLTLGNAMPCWARRLSRRAFEVFRLGTAMSGRRVYRKAPLDRTTRCGAAPGQGECLTTAGGTSREHELPRGLDRFQEASIVRHDDECPVIGAQCQLELLDGLEVEVVRRLVEE
jgi:hypothetical protein